MMKRRTYTLAILYSSISCWAYCDAFLQPKPQVTTACRQCRPGGLTNTHVNSNTPSSSSLRAIPQKFLYGAATFAFAAATTGIQIVRQGDVRIVERLGKFHSRLEPGFHLILPFFIDTIRATLTEREQVFDIPPQSCITSDNAPLTADAVVYWRVVDAKKAVYAVEALEEAIENLVLTQIRAEIGKLSLDTTFSAREQINNVLLDELDETTDSWGVKITRVEMRDIVPNIEILKAMEVQIAAERTKRAEVIKSIGERDKAINEAEGRARSLIIDAEANAKSVLLAADAEAKKAKVEAEGATQALDALASSMGGTDDAARFQLMRQFISAQRDLATSNNAKVVVSSGNVDDLFAKAVAFFNDDASDYQQQAPLGN